MATKFIELEEAAEMLGVTPEKLSEMREQNEVRGFRDGVNWKFKAEELEQLKALRQAGGSELGLDESVPLGDGPDAGDSILLSEKELGASESVGSSTVIGQSVSDILDHSDLKISDDELNQSDIELVGDSMAKGSDVHSGSGSDVLGGSGAVGSSDAGSELQLPSGVAESLEFDLSSDSDTVKSHESNLAIGESAADSQKEKADGQGDSGSEIDLTEEDDDLVLGGTGSDVIGASDSGISLGDPADSGLSLEEGPLELGGSVIGEDTLLLGEEDAITLDDGGESSETGELKSEDDFLLTPLETTEGDESESSSQVIELDTPELGFGASSPTAMDPVGDAGMAMGILEDELTGEGPLGVGPATFIEEDPAGVPMPRMAPAIPEAPYSIWNVLSMLVCIVILSIAGMLIYDLVRQVWSWDGVHPVNSGMMDAIIGMFR